MGEMITASLLQIWHIVPIIIGIILFRKFLNNKNKKRSIQIHEENEKNGLSLELRTAKKYEQLGYSVVQNTKEEDGVDLLCSRDDKTLLIQCNKSSQTKSINSEDIKAFIDDAIDYLNTNDMKDKGVEFRYAILFPEVLDKSAVKILQDDSYNCKYMVV